MEVENFFLQLPVDITTDIFSRLPVGSIIRCKLVCKAWRSLVEDPVFLDMHTSRLLQLPDAAAAAAAAVTTNTEFYLSAKVLPEYQFKYCFAECNNHHEMSSSSSSSSCFKLSKPLKDDDEPYSKLYYCDPIGSSNGLICSNSAGRRDIYVYNPCTRECVRVPSPTFISKQFGSEFSGFGYNPLTNEYKIVLIRSNHDEEGRKPGAEVGVYTLGSGKWRISKLESWNLNLNLSFIKPSVLFNGALHWIAWGLINIDHYEIFSFDLADEVFRVTVPSPPLSPRFNNLSCAELVLLGGCCLCVRQRNIVSKTTDIWVLRKDKDMNSWTMKFKVPAATTDYYHPIALLGRDKILLSCYKRDESVFVSYDSETGNFEDEVIDYSELQPSKSKWSICSVIPYTKSFVSLKPFGEDACLSF